MEPLMMRIRKGPIVMDGAMGTLLMSRWLKRDDPPDFWNVENSSEIISVHQEYVRAGAEILFTNTFNVARLKFEERLSSDRALLLSQHGVRLAREAAGEKAYVAGDVGPIGTKNLKKVTPSEFILHYTEQVESLCEAGVDLIALETMTSLEEAQLALHGAVEGTRRKIPVLLCVTLNEHGKMASGEDFHPLLDIAEAMGVELVGFNCSFSPLSMTDPVKSMKDWPRLIPVVKPNAGVPGKSETLSPEEFADAIKQLAAAGARLMGGCCGTTPEYIRRLSSVIPAPRG